MPIYKKLPPSARSLSASLRDIGYSLETAVADILDNSISAEATRIDIICDMVTNQPILSILDNGWGMGENELENAMRHGTIATEVERSPTDLGRFGLGLKTASFSQCRQLTVVSVQNGQYCGAEWDLDLVKEDDDWTISILNEQDIKNIPYIESLRDNGTLVLWRKMDRLFETEQKHKRDELISEKLAILRNHLELVFHRFLDGEFLKGKKLSITVNNHPLEAFDPFCKKSHPQCLPVENIVLDSKMMYIKPFILPYYSRLSAHDHERYKNRSDFLSNQGVYVYRNGRLMAWGSWFRLIPKGESTKLARIQIDFPSSLDDFWTIDIKKSTARPPQCVRDRLWQILPKIKEGSQSIIKRRGKADIDDRKYPIWERYELDECIKYAINIEHPLIKKFFDKLDENEVRILKNILESISSAIPVTSIYSDHATKPNWIENEVLSEEEILDKLKSLHMILFENSTPDKDHFIDIINSMPRIFSNNMDIVQKYVEEEMS